jgi:hypothetical protein
MTFVEILNTVANLLLFGLMIWRKPRLPTLWVWQIASILLIVALDCSRNTSDYATVWWGAALLGMILEFGTLVELLESRFSWVNEGAIILMILHLFFKGAEHYFWRDDEAFAWQLRHIAVVLNEILGGYLCLLVYLHPKGETYVLRRQKATGTEVAKAYRTSNSPAH